MADLVRSRLAAEPAVSVARMAAWAAAEPCIYTLVAALDATRESHHGLLDAIPDMLPYEHATLLGQPLGVILASMRPAAIARAARQAELDLAEEEGDFDDDDDEEEEEEEEVDPVALDRAWAIRRAAVLCRGSVVHCIADITRHGFNPEMLLARQVPPAMASLQSRYARMVQVIAFRHVHEAHRDARLVLRAAAEGRPLELQKRLRLGKLAGGLHAVRDTSSGMGMGMGMETPLEASRSGGHTACVDLLLEAEA